jgi:hypothetical protein
MPRMTEEEAWALDEEVTKNPPRVDPSKARYVLRTEKKAESPNEIIGEIICEPAAVSS